MKKLLTFGCLFLFILSASAAKSNTINNDWLIEYGKKVEFIEAKGQFNSRHKSLTNKDIRYAADENGKLIYFTPTGIIYHFYDAEKNKNRKRGDKSKPRIVVTHDLTEVVWLGSNPNVEIIPSDQTKTKHNYSYYANGKKEEKQVNNLNGYHEITYKNLYPNIDAIYEFHPQGGLKYSLILHPGANPDVIKMQYSIDKKIQINNQNQLVISTAFGDIVEQSPVTFYNRSKKQIVTAFTINSNNEVGFKLANYDRNKTVVIDPWVITPNFNTQWKCIWECERDTAGNTYVIGGVMPLQLVKYDINGGVVWTYNTPYDSTEWLGSFSTDRAGNSYITNGSPGKLIRVNPSGTQVWSTGTNTSGGLLTEFWSIAFNSTETELVVGGTGGALTPTPYTFRVNVTNGNVSNPTQMTGGQFQPPQEVRAITACNNGKFYYLTHDTIGYFNQNTSICNSTIKVPNNISFSYKCEDYRKDNSSLCALKAFGNHVYVNVGNKIEKRYIPTGAVVANSPIPGGTFTVAPIIGGGAVGNNGIDIDSCGNIYVGSQNQVVKYDANLVQLGTYPTSFNVYDVHVTTNGDIIAGGSTGNSGSGARTGYIQRISANACKILPISYCDPTICPSKTTFCIADASETLIPITPGGIWSGTGVNANGVFNPATAGVGTHVIKYTLTCGVDSVRIIVSNCTALNVCRETNGNFTVSGGIGPYTWAKDTTIQDCSACLLGCAIPLPPGCIVNQNVFVNFATGTTITPPGVYPIKVTDAAGTSYTITSANSVQPCSTTTCPTIIVSVQTSQNSTCASSNNGSATFSSTGGAGNYTYVWSPNVSNTASGSNLSSGTYNVTATDANGCTGTGSVTITAPQPVTVSTSNPTNTTCGQNNGGVSVTVGGGTTPYVVTVSNGVSQQTVNVPNAGTVPVSNLAPGTYTVTVRDANNCTSTQTITISATNTPTISSVSVNPETCSGESDGTLVNATASNGVGTLTWQYAPAATPANTTNVISFPVNNLAPGTYILTVRDANNCEATTQFTIGAGPQCCNLSITTNSTPADCGQNNGSISITPSPVGIYIYSWSNGLPSQSSQSGLAVGTYSVTVSQSGNPNCNVDTTITISNIGGPGLSFGNIIQPGCNLKNGSMEVTVTGNSAPYTVSIDTGSGSPITVTLPNSGTFPVTGVGVGTYTITATDNIGCVSINTIVFTEPAPPTVSNVAVANQDCNGNLGSVTLTVIGGATPYAVNWTNTNQTGTTINVIAGVYNFTVTDANNCTATGTSRVDTATGCCRFKISATSTNASCAGNDGSITVSIDSAGAQPYEYSVNGTNYQQSNVLSGLSASTYTVYGKDANGCGDTITVTVGIINNSLTLNLSTVQPICAGSTNGSVTAHVTDGTGAITYQWSVAGSDSTIGNLGAGTYSVTIRDANNCTLTQSATLTDPQALEVEVGNDVSFCDGDSATISATLDFTRYEWNNGNTNSSITVDSAGVYSVTVYDANGCTATDQVAVTVNAIPQINLPADTSVYENNTIVLNPIVSENPANGSYLWEPTTNLSCSNCANPTATTVDTITYSVTYTSLANCSSSTNITINVLKGAKIVMPTAFSPNGDNVNDVLAPKGIGVKSISWNIYNRWGQQVFTTDDYSKGWDGSYKGTQQPVGTYTFTLQVNYFNNTSEKQNGTVSLVR